MTVALHKTEDGTIELTISVPWASIKTTYESVVEENVKNAELPGFRKGKAPRKMVEESLDKTKVYEAVIRHIVPNVYNEALKKENLRPIVTPTVELKEATEEKDWVIIARTCEKPAIDLKDYKEKIKSAKSGDAKKLWVPGQEPPKEETLDAEKIKSKNLEIILKTLFETVTLTLPGLLVQQEANKLLSNLIDQTKRLGMTVEQYLGSTGRTAESIRGEYEEEAKRTLTLEFALEEIGDKEGILVSDDEIEAIIKSAKTDEERKGLENERYYLASILKRQKTLDFLSSL